MVPGRAAYKPYIEGAFCHCPLVAGMSFTTSAASDAERQIQDRAEIEALMC